MAHAQKQRDSLWSIRSTVGPISSAVLAAGALLILLGAALQTGVWAGMLGIVGGLLIFVTVLVRTLLWVYRLF